MGRVGSLSLQCRESRRPRRAVGPMARRLDSPGRKVGGVSGSNGSGPYERPSEVLVREVGDELVVLNTSSEQYLSLIDVGRRSYELLASGADIDATVATICAEYEVAPDVARADVVDLVSALLDSGLLRSA